MLRSLKCFFIALLTLVAATASALPTRAESANSRGWATPTVSPTELKCELEFVDGMIRECCKATGNFFSGVNNCTNFRRNFDDFCVKRLGPARCKSVTVRCPNGGGHALNMVQLSDGKWYLVEPQVEVYGDYPLPSPQIPDELLALVMPGCGCNYEISDFPNTPNTDPFACTGEDTDLWGTEDKYVPHPLKPMQYCLNCCKQLPISVYHPNPEWFHEQCTSDCEFAGLELSRDEYCAHRYRGEDCEFCCDSTYQPTPGCKQKCRPKTPECSPSDGVMWDNTPKIAHTSCAQKRLGSDEACYACCREASRRCHYRNSMPCHGWRMRCVSACGEKPSKPIASSSSQGSKSSAAHSSMP